MHTYEQQQPPPCSGYLQVTLMAWRCPFLLGFRHMASHKAWEEVI